MYKTYYIKFDDNIYDICGLITKAENINDAKIKFINYLNTNHKFMYHKIEIYQIQDLNKLEIVEFIL